MPKKGASKPQSSDGGENAGALAPAGSAPPAPAVSFRQLKRELSERCRAITNSDEGQDALKRHVLSGEWGAFQWALERGHGKGSPADTLDDDATPTERLGAMLAAASPELVAVLAGASVAAHLQAKVDADRARYGAGLETPAPRVITASPSGSDKAHSVNSAPPEKPHRGPLF